MGGRTRTSKPIKPEKRNKGGRPKGSPNKVGANAKAMLEQCIGMLNGVDGLYEWATEESAIFNKDGEIVGYEKKNLSAFWIHLFPRLLPLQITASVDHTLGVTDDGRQALQSALLGVIAAQRTAASIAAGSGTGNQRDGRAPVQVIDATAVREPVPQMVVLGSPRSKTA